MDVWIKIKNFFRRFWYVVLVPIGLGILHLFFRSSKQAKLSGQIKEQKKEIKEEKEKVILSEEKVVEKETEVLEDVKETEEKLDMLEEKIEAVDQIITSDNNSKELRDEKASKYLPNL